MGSTKTFAIPRANQESPWKARICLGAPSCPLWLTIFSALSAVKVFPLQTRTLTPPGTAWPTLPRCASPPR